MSLDAAAVRAALAQHYPGADRTWLPSKARRDLATKPNAPIHRGYQRLRVGQLGLELDDEQAAAGGVPGQDVDDASFAVDRETDLASPHPPSATSEEPHQ